MNENNGNNNHFSSKEEMIKAINTGSKSNVGSSRKRASALILAIVIGVAVLVIALGVAAYTVFRITEIEVEGLEYYSSEDIIEAIGIEVGDSIFFANEKRFAKRLAGDFPMIYSLKLEKKYEYPSGIKLIVTEEEPSYSFDYAGECAVVSKKGKIIYLGKTIPEKFSGVMKMNVPEVSLAVEGEVIKYRDDTDVEAVEEVLTKLRECTFKEQIAFVDMKSRFDIKVKYKDRFTILFGDRTDFEVKLKFVDGIIETLEKGEKGTINVKNPKKAYFIEE